MVFLLFRLICYCKQIDNSEFIKNIKFLQKRIDKHLFLFYNITIRTIVLLEVIYMKRAKKYRINGKRLLVNILFILGLFIIFNLLTSQIFGKKEIKTTDITIKSGDTLWGISSNICKKNSSLNIQEVIYDIKEINNLSSNEIIEGNVIQVPIYQ